MDKKGWIRFPTLSFFGEQLYCLPETDLDITGSTKMRFFFPEVHKLPSLIFIVDFT